MSGYRLNFHTGDTKADKELALKFVSHSDLFGGVQLVKAKKFKRESIILDIVYTPPLVVRVVHSDCRMQKLLYLMH